MRKLVWRGDYFGARYYDADIGRWTSVDPVQQYMDSYLYGGNSPINRIDPDGMQDAMWMKRFFYNRLWTQARIYKEEAPAAAGKAALIT
ncbi:MAG: hypothetical protein GF401_16930, partial [Chitinivibrionales bacterium]|nr:hypothetical protein [Chitinivibrionales bacterium]